MMPVTKKAKPVKNAAAGDEPVAPAPVGVSPRDARHGAPWPPEK